MTTVGYGGAPATEWGKVITIVLLLVGIGFVAIVTGAVAERFLTTEIEDVADATAEVGATAGEMLAELRAIRARLERLEVALQKRAP
jgi:Na+(H+)/acetate symporter ActP